jgi:hypothetical protein
MVFAPQHLSPKPTAVSEQLGAFGAYIQRPTPKLTGMTALFFGENGVDSDTISALSLNKFQNIQVFVVVYLVKDPVGRIMKKDGKYPIIAQFNGFINRPNPQKAGMVAQFFAPNGIDANAVVELGKTEYQDSLVYVDIRSNQSISDLTTIELENTNVINESYMSRITKKQKEFYQKKEKEFRKMNEKLDLSTFFYRPDVLKSVGTPQEYTQWLEAFKTCAFPLQNKHCTIIGQAEKIEQFDGEYNYLPLCSEHFHKVQDLAYFEENKSYYTFKHQILLREWVAHFFKVNFSIDGNSEPDPGMIFEWAVTHNLVKHLPSDYKPVN